ncbi:nuclear transport factor 2 family protein [Streptomyces sp. NPDC096538]|uniref:nuclear transport factor 2 family protein n=1 Tax=Streptomyces sp. NPDC096538 TaxID=3155427 RepID=UPI00331984C8
MTPAHFRDAFLPTAHVEVYGSVATATMTLRHGADTFTDVFLLVRTGGKRRIANKACHRHA